MPVFETELDGEYKDFNQISKRDFIIKINKKFEEVYCKRLVYYCQSRKWTEDVFDMKWASGLNLRYLFKSNQKLFVVSEHRDPTEKVYAGGKLQYHFVFTGISPILQNFVAFRLWPEQVERAREVVIGLRKAIDDRKIPIVKLSGSVGLYWPHTDLRLQQGNASIVETLSPEDALQQILLIPGLHREARDLTWWQCLSDYKTGYIASDEKTHFMAGGITIARLDQKLTNHCQFHILGDNFSWSQQLFRFRYAGFRSQEKLGGAGDVYSLLFFRQFDQKTGLDHFWIQDVADASPLDTLLHLIMRKLYLTYLHTCRLKIINVKELESLSTKYLSKITRFLIKERNESLKNLGLNIPSSLVVRALLSGYYRKIDNDIYFIPPGLHDETDYTIKFIDEKISELKEKDNEKSEFFKDFINRDEVLETAFLTWIMARINHGFHPLIPKTLGHQF